jgi:hypothetical protein
VHDVVRSTSHGHFVTSAHQSESLPIVHFGPIPLRSARERGEREVDLHLWARVAENAPTIKPITGNILITIRRTRRTPTRAKCTQGPLFSQGDAEMEKKERNGVHGLR